MLLKSGLLLLLVTVLQVSARSKYVEPDFIENVIKRESEADPESRIVSGWQAHPGQHPHHAALRLVNQDGTVVSCGGSIVAKEWVITAAHCTARRVSVVVRGGVVSLTNPEYIGETREWYNHPLFDDFRPLVVQTNDIAVVKLQTPVVYTDLLRPIRVQSRADAYRNYDGEQVYASGHGLTWTAGSVSDVLKWVYLRAVSNNACASLYGTALIVDSSICARYFNVTSQSTCHGDSGGPLVHVGSDDVPTLIGVTSFVAGGDFGCHSGLPAGFIRPGPYLSWLKDVTGVDFENLQEDDGVTTPIPEESEEDEATSTAPPPVEDEATTPAPLPESEEDEDEAITTTPAPLPESEEDEDDDIATTPAPLPESEEDEDYDIATTPAPLPESEEDDEEAEATTPAPPAEDSEEQEEEEDSDSSESDEDEEMKELLKRLTVKVKVLVKFDKYKVKNSTSIEKEKQKHH